MAIGDGANDVAMLKRADVGVGIIGREGKQAAMCSDYSIVHFRYLRDLLLVHGHWCYRRLALIALYSLYKNPIFAMVILMMYPWCGWSGSVNIDSLYAAGGMWGKGYGSQR